MQDEMVACDVRMEPRIDGFYVSFEAAGQSQEVGPMSEDDAKALFEATVNQEPSVRLSFGEYPLRPVN